MNLKFQSFLLKKEDVTAMIKAMRDAKLNVNVCWEAGTVEAFYGKTLVFMALEKGKGQPWIVRHVVDLFS
jgi:hypothetical protein